jgi:hypothetical protein
MTCFRRLALKVPMIPKAMDSLDLVEADAHRGGLRK